MLHLEPEISEHYPAPTIASTTVYLEAKGPGEARCCEIELAGNVADS